MATDISTSSADSAAPLRFAVVGSGPSGLYACDALLNTASQAGHDILIDVFERLPVPYGLLRFGVAPDHPRIKGIARVLAEILSDPRIRLHCGVTFGTDLTWQDAQRLYSGVIVCTGALADRAMGIPGEQLAGVHGAAEFVTWYDGHPDAALDWDLSAEHVAVIGVGNVALDVARMLLRAPTDLDITDIPAEVRSGFAAGRARCVSVIGRRGPAWVKFTLQELREIGRLDGIAIVLDPTELVLDEAARERLNTDRRARQIFELFCRWAAETAKQFPEAIREDACTGDRDSSAALAQRSGLIEVGGEQIPAFDPDAVERAALAAGNKVIRFRFHRAPQEFVGTGGQVQSVLLARTEPTADGELRVCSDTLEKLEAGAVYTAVGYRSTELPGIPFDAARSVIPHDSGRVLDEQGEVVRGLYTAGWIKRGPSGVIGTNKACAAETVRALWHDWESGLLASPAEPDPEAVTELLRDREVRVVDRAGWEAIDEHERRLGAEGGRERTKLRDRNAMLDIALGLTAHSR